MSFVSIRNLQKSDDGTGVLHGVDLGIRAGEVTVVVGQSGRGKSTLIHMIVGPESVTDGEIRIGEAIVNELEPARRGCAMVFQNHALYPYMTVAENIGYPLRLARVPRAERDKRVREVAEILGLEAYLARRPKQLSGGRRQRVAMGRAIIREPKVFLFDAPLWNLDAKRRVQMRTEPRRLHRRLSVTSILVTHDQVEAMTTGDRLVVMNGGWIAQVRTPAEVYARPASVFVAGFLGSPSMNLFPARAAGNGMVVLDNTQEAGIACEAALPAGTALTAGIRPEDVLLGPDAHHPRTGIVDLVEDLDGHRVVHVRMDDVMVTAIITQLAELREGQPVPLSFSADRLHAFSGETGGGRRRDGMTGSSRAGCPGDWT